MPVWPWQVTAQGSTAHSRQRCPSPCRASRLHACLHKRTKLHVGSRAVGHKEGAARVALAAVFPSRQWTCRGLAQRNSWPAQQASPSWLAAQFSQTAHPGASVSQRGPKPPRLACTDHAGAQHPWVEGSALEGRDVGHVHFLHGQSA